MVMEIDVLMESDVATETEVEIATEKRGSVVPLQTSGHHLKFDAGLS